MMKIIHTATTLFLILCIPQFLYAKDIQEDRFQVADNTFVIDTNTGLMWALNDNGKDIDWWGS